MNHVLELANEANSQPLFDRGIVLRHSRRGYPPVDYGEWSSQVLFSVRLRE